MGRDLTLPTLDSLTLFRAATIPVAIVTGFLGSGKTTLIRHLLESRALEDTLVIVSEFGEIGLDHLIVGEITEDVVLLEGGCLCCGQSGDLARVLGDMLQRRELGRVPAFARVIIETSGLADPLPILQTFLTDPLRLSLYRPAAIVTVIDGALGTETLAAHANARQQLALADLVLVTKLDLPGTDFAASQGSIRAHGSAPVYRADAAWPIADIFASAPANIALADTHKHPTHFTSRSHRIDRDLDPAHVDRWITQTGSRLLRVKALLPVIGAEQPIILQMARHLVTHQRLAAWPESTRRGFVTAIAEDMPPAALDDLLRDLCN